MIGIIHLRLRISLDVGALLTISLSHEIFGCWVAKKNVRMYGYGSIRNACTQERIIRSDWRKFPRSLRMWQPKTVQPRPICPNNRPTVTVWLALWFV